MLNVRVIPCLDCKNGRVVKGVKFANLRDAGDPAVLARAYQDQGADEIVLLDIAATPEGRSNQVATVKSVRQELSIPFTVGGGIRSLQDAETLLASGADKVSVNTAAVVNPNLLDELARQFGSQCVVLAVDVTLTDGAYKVIIESGGKKLEKDALAWGREAVARGAGEILLTSFDRDGTRQGYDLGLISAFRQQVDVPLIASGGASTISHLHEAIVAGADAVLAASIFHDGDFTVHTVKKALEEKGVRVRL